jgi:hypothetical protein
MNDAPHRAIARHYPTLAKFRHQRSQGQIRHRNQACQQPVTFRRQRPRLLTTDWLRSRAACLPKPLRPLHHARNAHPKQPRRLTARSATRHRRRNPFSQIVRIGFRHSMLTSITASILNQKSVAEGIPLRFNLPESDSSSRMIPAIRPWRHRAGRGRTPGGRSPGPGHLRSRISAR